MGFFVSVRVGLQARFIAAQQMQRVVARSAHIALTLHK